MLPIPVGSQRHWVNGQAVPQPIAVVVVVSRPRAQPPWVLELQQVIKFAVLAWKNPQRSRVLNSGEGDTGFCGRVASHHQAFKLSHDDNEALHRRALKLVEGHGKRGLDFKGPDGNWFAAKGVGNVRRHAGAKGLKKKKRNGGEKRW